MLNPYLFYQDSCEAAFTYYARVLGGKIEAMMRAEEAPAEMPCPPERKKSIMHARMTIAGSTLMASDAPAEHYNKPQGQAVSLTIQDSAEAERKFNALADGGSVTMPFGKTFFSKGFGMCTDRFGIPWMVNSPLEGM
jgi:PhnB protein